MPKSIIDYFQLTQQIRKLVAEDELNEALKILSRRFSELEDRVNLTNQIERLAKARENVFLGKIPEASLNAEKNAIAENILALVKKLESTENPESRVFISYNRINPSKSLATELSNELQSEGIQVFMDGMDMPVGSDWAVRMLNELKASDYFVLFLSKETNYSEMILKQVEVARKLKDQNGKPIILPVRVRYPADKALSPQLQSWLSQAQHLTWENNEDTKKVFLKLIDVIIHRKAAELTTDNSKSAHKLSLFLKDDERPPLPKAFLEVPRGSVRLDS
ncbi:MAG: TIR domain-containing protein, partial [Bacteroidota bacterium]